MYVCMYSVQTLWWWWMYSAKRKIHERCVKIGHDLSNSSYFAFSCFHCPLFYSLTTLTWLFDSWFSNPGAQLCWLYLATCWVTRSGWTWFWMSFIQNPINLLGQVVTRLGLPWMGRVSWFNLNWNYENYYKSISLE